QTLVTLEDQILLSAVDQAKAEKLAQRSEILTAQSQVGDAQIKVEQARLQLQQAQGDITKLETSLNARIEQARLQVRQTQADADRLELLVNEGVGSSQQAEQARTTAQQAQQLLRSEEASAAQQLSQARTAARTAARILDSAQAQVKIEQQQVAAATAQMNAQQAAIDQAKTRQQFATIKAPFPGTILQRLNDPGDWVQPGSAILTLGDFSQLTIKVQVSELALPQIRPQQTVTINLDAFPNQRFDGKVARLSPLADPTSRLIPVEITLPNPDRRIGAGLLARVRFPTNGPPTVVVPTSAIQNESELFVVTGPDDRPVLERRSVQIGQKKGDKVEILAGLDPQERYVARSSRPLKPDSQIRLSILSQSPSP
ncbi:MAG: efflux RND transporter periplasmic adaptor subunit, partial [Synechocystis sp.]